MVFLETLNSFCRKLIVGSLSPLFVPTSIHGSTTGLFVVEQLIHYFSQKMLNQRKHITLWWRLAKN